MNDISRGSIPADDVAAAFARTIGSRHAAAEILIEVAEAGSTGNYAHDISGEVLGAALWRMALNSHEADMLAAITRGWQAADAQWRGQFLSRS